MSRFANHLRTIPPEGHTPESWRAALKIAEVLDIGPIEIKPPKRQPIQALRDGKSYVYFIGGEEGAIKIGVSIAPVERLIAMQMGCPIKLSILAKVEGAVVLEKKYHARFGEHRSHGEWFHRHPDILAEIARLNRKARRGGTAEHLGRF